MVLGDMGDMVATYISYSHYATVHIREAPVHTGPGPLDLAISSMPCLSRTYLMSIDEGNVTYYGHPCFGIVQRLDQKTQDAANLITRY
jgi:hypothetical protein